VSLSPPGRGQSDGLSYLRVNMAYSSLGRSSAARWISSRAMVHARAQAGFHFAFIEQGGTSFYPKVAHRVTNVEVLRILLSIGGTEKAHFQTWHDKAGNAPPVSVKRSENTGQGDFPCCQCSPVWRRRFSNQPHYAGALSIPEQEPTTLFHNSSHGEFWSCDGRSCRTHG
jgi:hypothetical protein